MLELHWRKQARLEIGDAVDFVEACVFMASLVVTVVTEYLNIL